MFRRTSGLFTLATIAATAAANYSFAQQYDYRAGSYGQPAPYRGSSGYSQPAPAYQGYSQPPAYQGYSSVQRPSQPMYQAPATSQPTHYRVNFEPASAEYSTVAPPSAESRPYQAPTYAGAPNSGPTQPQAYGQYQPPAYAASYQPPASAAAPAATETKVEETRILEPGFHCTTCATRWFGRAEALWLDRSNHSEIFLGNFGATILRSDDIEFNRELGARFVLGRQLNDFDSVELSYFGLMTWDSMGAAIAGAGGFSPFITPDGLLGTNATTGLGGLPVTSMLGVYDSDLHNIELNVRRQIAPNASILGGLRYIKITEDFRLDGISAAGVINESTLAQADNDLFGPQVGGEIGRRWGIFGVELWGNTGLLLNYSDTAILGVTDPFGAGALGPRTNLNRRNDDLDGAAMMEMGFMSSIRLMRNLEFRGGYQMLMITGVALAPEQLDRVNGGINPGPATANSGTGVNSHGNVIFHGPSIGIEYMWGGSRM